MQESGYHSGVISKDKDRKNLLVSPFFFFTGSEFTCRPLMKTCGFYGKDAITSSFNEFKMVLAVPVRENRGILGA